MWKCKCLKCNNEGIFIGKKITNTPSQKCRRCGTIGKMGGGVWANILSGAKSRNIEVKLSIEEAYNIYLSQNGKCALTGLDIELGRKAYDNITASLDRINSDIGYTKNNVQWVHKAVNRMKGRLSNQQFYTICLLTKNYCNNKIQIDSNISNSISKLTIRK